MRKLLAEAKFGEEQTQLSSFEFGTLANLVPATGEEAKTLLKSLERVRNASPLSHCALDTAAAEAPTAACIPFRVNHTAWTCADTG